MQRSHLSQCEHDMHASQSAQCWHSVQSTQRLQYVERATFLQSERKVDSLQRSQRSQARHPTLPVPSACPRSSSRNRCSNSLGVTPRVRRREAEKKKRRLVGRESQDVRTSLHAPHPKPGAVNRFSPRGTWGPEEVA